MEREIGEHWLTIATRDLCSAAKERISLEIVAHFDEAVKAYMAEGNSCANAERIALNDLGNPKAARRRFKDKHLTNSEARRLERWTVKPTHSLPLFFEALLATAFLISVPLVVYSGDYPMLFTQGVIFLWLEKRIAQFVLKRINRPEQKLDRVVDLDLLRSIAGVSVITHFILKWNYFIGLSFALLSFGFVLHWTLRLRQKAKNDRLNLI